jgi:hypothetical protein
VSERTDTALLEESRATAEALYRTRRRRALLGGGVAVLAVLGMVLVLYSPFNSKSLRFAIAMLGVGGISLGGVSAMQAYGAWGIRRVYDAALVPPPAGVIDVERRRSRRAATVCGAVAALGWALMFAADKHKWLGPIASVLFLGGCGGFIHYLQVWHVTRILRTSTPGQDGAAVEQRDAGDEGR